MSNNNERLEWGKLVPIDSIDVPEEWRTLDEDHILDLMGSIQEVSLMHPILINSENRLLAGRHRLEACRRLGWDTIPVTVLDCDSATHQELITIDENIGRKGLNGYDLVTALARRKQIYEELYPETRHGGKRVAGAEREGAKSFVVDTAEKTNSHKDSISRLVRIGSNLIALPASLKGHPLVNTMKELELLSRQGQELQQTIVDMLESGEVKTVKEALAARNGHDGAGYGGDGGAVPGEHGERPQVQEGEMPSCSEPDEVDGEVDDEADGHVVEVHDVTPSQNGERTEVQDGETPSCSVEDDQPADSPERRRQYASYELRINDAFDELEAMCDDFGDPAELADQLEDLRGRFHELRNEKTRRDGPQVLPLPPQRR